MKYIYGILCILGIVLPLSMLIPWLSINGLNVVKLYVQVSQDHLSAFAWLDVIVSALALIAFIIYEGRRQGISTLWLPVGGTLAIGVSFGLPMFLLMRELHAETSSATKPGQSDS
ncbi:DUF2834 domain-containing protein [Amphritea atlantica]|uniref:DUF2834 domain-containing protein n=1 Tax=Amphritea atlantica TaxID=355243 RepID=A0ABY5GZL4_9GAMM|nr:DUF2834 domain-containing protein [Amphritea atlantica]